MIEFAEKAPHVDLEDFWTTVPAQWTVGFSSAIEDLEHRLETGIVPGFMTGLHVLDEYIRLAPAEYTLIGARSGQGKTAFAMQLVDAVTQQQDIRAGEGEKPGIIVFFSAEMDRKTLAMREAAAMTGIPQPRIRSKYATDDEIRQYIAAMHTADAKYRRVWIDPSSAPTIQHMVDHLTILAEEFSIDLVLFDYLELSGEDERSENLRVAAISRGLKAIAKRFICPVVGLSQLNRNVEKRSEKKPMMSDIMYGGEREPDQIVLLQRHDEQENRTDAYVVKNRNGALGEVALLFDGPRMRFSSATVPQQNLNE